MASTHSFDPAPTRADGGAALALWGRRLVLAALALAAVRVGWTGFIASDDASYYAGAVEWLRDPPFAGDSHWTTRFPVVLTLAAALLLLGPGPAALAATALFWYAAFVAAGAALGERIGGRRAAWYVAALLATLPLAATAASIVNCDLVEATFLMLGLWLLAGTLGKAGRPEGAALGAGLCFGLAVLTRETAVLSLAAFLPLFLAGRPLPRRTLLLAAGAGAAVLGAEMLFQLTVTGDPLHRYLLAFNHDDSLSRAAGLEGNLLVHPLLDPLLVLFVNNEFGLLFWLAAAALALRVDRSLTAGQRHRLWLVAAPALASVLLVSLLSTKLVLNPRYFTLAAVCAALAAGLWLARARPPWGALLLAGTVAVNLLMLGAQNADPQWPSKALVLAAAEHPDRVIVADAEVVRRAELPLRWRGLDNVAATGAAGSLHLVEAAGEARPAIARYPSPPTPLGALLRAAGITALLPGAVEARLVTPNPTMLLVGPPAAPVG